MKDLRVAGHTVDAGLARALTAVLAVALLLLGVVVVSVAALAVGALLGLAALTSFLVQSEDRRHSRGGSA